MFKIFHKLIFQIYFGCSPAVIQGDTWTGCIRLHYKHTYFILHEFSCMLAAPALLH